MKAVTRHQECAKYRNIISEWSDAKAPWPGGEQCLFLIQPCAHAWQEIPMPCLGHRSYETYGFQRLPKETEANDQVSESPAALSPELVVVRDLTRQDAMEARVAFPVPDWQRPTPEITFIATPMRATPALGATILRNAMSEFGRLLDAVMKERDTDTL